MPALYGSVPASERDAEEGQHHASVTMMKPGVFEAVIQPARRRADILTGGTLVAGCLVLAVSLTFSSGAQRADTAHAAAPAIGGQPTGSQVSSESGAQTLRAGSLAEHHAATCATRVF